MLVTVFSYRYKATMKPGIPSFTSTRLLDQLRERIRHLHYSLQTEKAYWSSPKEGQRVNVLKPNQRATVYMLLERGSTQREIARITGIDRKTVRSYQRRGKAEQANSPGVATGSEAVAGQATPPWPPAAPSVSVPVATSLCEPYREFIEAQLRLKRNATAIYQDLVDQHGFAGQYNSVKRFVAKLSPPDEYSSRIAEAAWFKCSCRHCRLLGELAVVVCLSLCRRDVAPSASFAAAAAPSAPGASSAQTRFHSQVRPWHAVAWP